MGRNSLHWTKILFLSNEELFLHFLCYLTGRWCRYSGPVTSWLRRLRGAEEAEAGEEEAAARPDTSVRARLRQVQARSGAAVSLCDRLGGLEVRDTGAVLLFSSLVRSLKQRTRSLVHFYCGITEARGLPGYVYTNK